MANIWQGKGLNKQGVSLCHGMEILNDQFAVPWPRITNTALLCFHIYLPKRYGRLLLQATTSIMFYLNVNPPLKSAIFYHDIISQSSRLILAVFFLHSYLHLYPNPLGVSTHNHEIPVIQSRVENSRLLRRQDLQHTSFKRRRLRSFVFIVVSLMGHSSGHLIRWFSIDLETSCISRTIPVVAPSSAASIIAASCCFFMDGRSNFRDNANLSKTESTLSKGTTSS